MLVIKWRIWRVFRFVYLPLHRQHMMKTETADRSAVPSPRNPTRSVNRVAR